MWANSLALSSRLVIKLVMGAPQTPPRKTVVRQETTPPPLIRERPAFLHPQVCFVAALTGESVEITARTMSEVKKQIALLVDTLPWNVSLFDKHHGAFVDETRHSFAAEVLVYIHDAVTRVPEFPR